MINNQAKLISLVIRISLINLLLVSIIGLFLRWYFVSPAPAFIFRNWLHAHSHIAFLGWIYPVLFISMFNNYALSNSQIKALKILFTGMQVSIVGMLVTFPIYGYAGASILFSALHMIVSFILMARVLGLMKYQGDETSNSLIKLSFVFLVVSSLGPVILGFVTAMDLKDTYWYDLAIYFYLHFQYNGWFILAVCGLLVFFIHQYSPERLSLKGWLSPVTVIAFVTLTYLLSTVEIFDSAVNYVVGGLAAILQFIFFFLFSKWTIQNRKSWYNQLTATARMLIKVAGLALFLKITLQLLTSLPALTEHAYANRDLVVAYLHLVLLGLVSVFLLGWMRVRNWIPESRLTKYATITFLTGFITVEILLVFRGTIGVSPTFGLACNLLLFIMSFIILSGVFLFLIVSFQKNNKPIYT